MRSVCFRSHQCRYLNLRKPRVDGTLAWPGAVFLLSYLIVQEVRQVLSRDGQLLGQRSTAAETLTKFSGRITIEVSEFWTRAKPPH